MPGTNILETGDTRGTPPWGLFRARLLAYVRSRLDDPADAEDLVQEILARAAARLPELRDGGRLLPWLHRVARNSLIDHYRRRGRRSPTVALEDLPDAESPSVPPDGAGGTDARAALAACLHPMLATLPPDYREALRKVDLEGRRQVDVARELGLGDSALKSRVQRGRKLLHQAFTDCCAIEQDAAGRVTDFRPRGPSGCAG